MKYYIAKVMTSVIMTALCTQSASAAFDLGSIATTVVRPTGPTYQADGVSVAQVFSTEECLPLKLSSFRLNVKAGETLPYAATSVRLKFFTNEASLTAGAPVYSYEMNTQSGLQWTPLTATTFTGGGPLPNDRLPVTATLIVTVSVQGYENVTLIEERVTLAFSKVDKGILKKTESGWLSVTNAKLSLQINVEAEQPSYPLTLKVVAMRDYFGPYIRISWPRGLDYANLQLKAIGAVPATSRYYDWSSWRSYGSSDEWYLETGPLRNDLPAPGMLYRLVQ